nr:uncharacterized protein LOC113800008 [Penaeus vannamei]
MVRAQRRKLHSWCRWCFESNGHSGNFIGDSLCSRNHFRNSRSPRNFVGNFLWSWDCIRSGSQPRTFFGNNLWPWNHESGSLRRWTGALRGWKCDARRVNRRVFLYDVPSNVQTSGPVNIPDPHVETNIVLIRTPEGGLGQQPVVIPPPRQNHVVYILNKQNREGPGVIEVPSSGPSTPEVYFVNYAEGENPTLPGGVDLQSALQAASQGAAQAVGLVGQSSSTVGQNVGSTGYSGVQNFGSRIPSGSFSGQVTGLSGQSASFRDQAIGSESAGQTTPDFDLRGSTQNVGSAGLAVSTSGRAGTADSTGQPILSNGQVSGPAISSGSSSSQVIELTGQFASLDDQAIGSAGRSAFSGAKIPGAVSPASSTRGSSVASQPSGLYT